MDRLVIGCGYLGERVACAWRDAGDRVFALTRSADRARRLADRGLTPILGDVTDPGSLAELPPVQTVLYAVGLDRASGMTQRQVYVEGLRNVLPRLPGSIEQFLYISSTSVYGQNAGEWVNESSPCEPTTANGQVCLEAEQLVWQRFPQQAAYPAVPSLGVCVLRLAGLYGPGRWIARVDALRAGQVLSGNPRAWLNLIHVDDAAATVRACALRGAVRETYLVCDDAPSMRCEFYAGLAKRVAAPPPKFADDAVVADQGLNKRCCNRKIREQLGICLMYPRWETGLTHALATTSHAECP